MPMKKTSVTLYDRTLVEIKERGDERSSVINRDLDRYYEALRMERSKLREMLSSDEIGLLVDSLNGVILDDTYGIRLIYAGVEDRITFEGVDKKWNVDGAALVEKLRQMSFIQLCAIADAKERWWEYNHNHAELEDALA